MNTKNTHSSPIKTPLSIPTPVNKIREVCDAKEWTKDRFVGEMLITYGIKPQTSRLLYNGKTEMRLSTAVAVARLLQVELKDIIEI